MDSFDAFEWHDAILVLHQFGQHEEDFHESIIDWIWNHDVVAGLVALWDLGDVDVFQDEEAVSTSLHIL